MAHQRLRSELVFPDRPARAAAPDSEERDRVPPMAALVHQPCSHIVAEQGEVSAPPWRQRRGAGVPQ